MFGVNTDQYIGSSIFSAEFDILNIGRHANFHRYFFRYFGMLVYSTVYTKFI